MTTTFNPAAVPMYGPEHAADPQRSFALLREQGHVGLAEVEPGILVWVITDYRAALDLLQDTTGMWTKDTRGLMEHLPSDSPVMQMLQWRPNLFFAEGAEHAHLRSVITDSFALLDPQHVRDVTRRHADTLLHEFAHLGTADLVSQYARRLPLMVLNSLFGMPDEYAAQLYMAIESMMSTDPRAKGEGEQSLGAYLDTLYELKAAQRGRDLTSWFIDHPNRLAKDEVKNQVMLAQGAAYETLASLIVNTCCRMLSDPRYRGTLTTGSLPIQHAVEDVLWNDPPLAMSSLHRPRRDLTFHSRHIRAGAPVMVSYAAVNTCPHSNQSADGFRSDRKAHLAFAGGPHECPARSIAFVIATTAIERLTSLLPDIELSIPPEELTYKAGPIYRILNSLPCRFTARARAEQGSTPWSQRTAPTGHLPAGLGVRASA